MTLPRRLARGHAIGDELRRPGDNVIGGKHQTDGVVARARRHQCAYRDSRRRIAAFRFEDNGACDAHLLHLFGDYEAKFVSGDHNRRREFRTADALQSGLKRRKAVAHQSDELLWHLLARYRPQAGSRSTGHDDGDDFAFAAVSCHQITSRTETLAQRK